MSSDQVNVTELINRWKNGDSVAGNELFDTIDRQLKKIANKRLGQGGNQRRLRATEMVNEAYLLLDKQQQSNWVNREQFFKIAAMLMNRVIIDALRYDRAGVRDWRLENPADAPGVEIPSPTRHSDPAALVETQMELERLDVALEALAADNPVAHDVLLQRAFEHRTLRSIASDLHLSEDAVGRKWTYATAFLADRLSQASSTRIR